ncbi:hypothetical protein F5Y05DRAFT_364280 [Hypoxylon sp. FL0543]|nr:hypothetical protein F5Y05DRAFT_364280 [Hypoxylon sp. FL0543]
MNRDTSNSLLDRHNRTIAGVLAHFKNMIESVTEPIPTTGNIIEQAALNRLRMETETNAFIAEVENIVKLTREIRALWLRGPLRQPGQDAAREAELDRQSAAVATLYENALAMRNNAIRREAVLRAQAGLGPSTAAAAGTSAAGPSAAAGSGP